jgi:hypothetical protein
LAATCDFASVDNEVKSAIIQNCSSKRLRRYALLDNEVTLAKLLAKGRAFELSESQATGIEKSLETARYLSPNPLDAFPSTCAKGFPKLSSS